MTTIARLALEKEALGHEAPESDRWDGIASLILDWALAVGVELRDAVVLLPFAQLLPVARRAFARAGGWMPRVETTRTLAASLGPALFAQPGELSFDVTIDGLNAAALLRSQPWGAGWARRDPRSFDQAAAALTDTAQALALAAFAVAPCDRVAHWARAREVLAPVGGPGSVERLLARMALEWASLASTLQTDRLFDLPAVAAWIGVQAGGADPLVARLLAQASVPSLQVNTDADPADPFEQPAAMGFRVSPPTCAVLDSFEEEAACTAAQVLAHVARGEVPVVLIAQDRVLMRRVRALLEREQVGLLDETGWRLSTTRAGAQVMTLLRAAQSDASTDALIDWLKVGTGWSTAWSHSRTGATEGRHALAELESVCRRGKIARVAALAHAPLTGPAGRLWENAAGVLRAFVSAPQRSVAGWLEALAQALGGCGALQLLQADDAGRQLLAALRLIPATTTDAAWAHGAGLATLDLDGFVGWVDGVLEQASFVPAHPRDEPAEVVITPLVRAMLRPFAAAVLAGADHLRLGASPIADRLLSDATAGLLGLPTAAQRRAAETLAFVQLLAIPRLTFLRRRSDAGEPLADSPLVDRLALALASGGRTIGTWADPRIDLAVRATPIRMSAPVAPELLPMRLSASACEALRACPYRFFVLYLLRLREDDELDREIDQREYGNWVHEVLFDFHTQRETPAERHIEVARLLALAESHRVANAMGDADFLPFTESFTSLAPRYIDWLHQRDAEGARWRGGEETLTASPPELGGVEMHGIVDRIDQVRTVASVGSAASEAVEMIDYKTGSVPKLKDRLKDRLEDTQLAFYAALMQTRTNLPLRARYLALDGSKALEDPLEHVEVEDSAARLVAGLAHDLSRLRTGSGLPALGSGSTCDHCAARGVCRRDHWADDALPPNVG